LAVVKAALTDATMAEKWAVSKVSQSDVTSATM
jgi:hypothetical protein